MQNSKKYSPYETLRPGKHEFYPKFPWAEIGSGAMDSRNVWGSRWGGYTSLSFLGWTNIS
jgi:hypothetical protein